MSQVHRLSRAEARRIAVRAQLLSEERPAGVVEVVRRLFLVQLDPTRAVAPSAELVVWSRLGSACPPSELWSALDQQWLIELRGTLRAAEDIALYTAEMACWPDLGASTRDWEVAQADWVETNNACRLDILDLLRTDGPLHLRDLPDACVRPWTSSGWNNHQNLKMMLDLLVRKGEVAAAGGTGRHRLWDLASRIYPDDPPVPVPEALRLRDQRRLSSLGIARSQAPEQPFEPLHVGEAGEPAVIEGVQGRWRVDPSQLGQPFAGRAVLLSPFDRLLSDRNRMADLFGFDYVLEMYKPAARRRWGYYALPILYGDRLVGKLDARAERDAGVLSIAAVHQDVPFTRAMTVAVDREIKDLARWLDLEPEWPS